VPTCYLALGALHGALQAGAGQVQGLHRDPQGQRLPVAAHHADRPLRHAGRGADPRRRHAPRRRIGRRLALAVQGRNERSTALQQKTHKWLQSLLELQSTTGDSSEFLEHVKVDLFPGEVYVFSPKGKIFALPRGATPVDFAYAVHTDIGDRCVACRINFDDHAAAHRAAQRRPGRDHHRAHAAPNPAWLGYVKTARARSKIRHFLKTMQYEESAALGERLLSHALRDLGLALAKLPAQAWDRFKRASGARSQKAVLADIGLGKRLPAIVARRLAEGVEADAATAASNGRSRQAILIHGPKASRSRWRTAAGRSPATPSSA
jgi:guanosine-3',5'-bis(diphosphate) 3'-pyrophosphohydrolase